MDEEEELENALIGQNPMMEEQPVFNTQDQIMGGLGLGGAAYAAQTGRLPTTPPSPQVLNILTGRDAPRSAFAQRVAANDAARLAARFQPPALIGSTQVGTTGVFQPPAVTYTGGPPATTSTGTPPKGQPRLTGPTRLSADDFDFKIGGNKPRSGFRIPTAVTNLASNVVKGGVVTGLLTPNTMGRAEVFPQGTLFEDVDGNISLVPREGFVPLNLSDRPEGVSFIQADQEAETPAFTNTIEEIIAAKNARGPGARYTQEELSSMNQFLTDVDEDTSKRESNIVNNQVELAKQINELGTVTDDQRAVQDFMNERAERAFEKPTDVITPFQDQAQLTADLFTSPDTAIGQFVPRSTSTLPDGTIIQEDEGGNRREISPEQLRQFEQDMAGLGQAQQSRTFSQEETMDRLGGMTLNEYLNAPAGTTGVSGLRTDPQGRMITPTPQPAAPQPVAGVAEEIASGQPAGQPANTQAPVNQLSPFEEASLERQQRIGGTGSFEGDSEARDARVRENERRPGESQADRDTRVAQSKTTGGQTGGMSFDDARRRAEGQLVARGVRNPTASQINSLARSIQAGEEERLTDLELKRDLTQRRIDTMDAQLAQSGIVPEGPPVVDPETGVITQEYSDGTTRFKGVGRSPSGGGFDLDGFLPGDEGDENKVKSSNIPPAAIDYLIANPNTFQMFDQTYGAGESSKILNKK